MPLDTPRLSLLRPLCLTLFLIQFFLKFSASLTSHKSPPTSLIIAFYPVSQSSSSANVLDPHSPQVGHCFLSHSFIFLHYSTQSWPFAGDFRIQIFNTDITAELETHSQLQSVDISPGDLRRENQCGPN